MFLWLNNPNPDSNPKPNGRLERSFIFAMTVVREGPSAARCVTPVVGDRGWLGLQGTGDWVLASRTTMPNRYSRPYHDS